MSLTRLLMGNFMDAHAKDPDHLPQITPAAERKVKYVSLFAGGLAFATAALLSNTNQWGLRIAFGVVAAILVAPLVAMVAYNRAFKNLRTHQKN